MATCRVCSSRIDDSVTVCPICGNPTNATPAAGSATWQAKRSGAARSRTSQVTSGSDPSSADRLAPGRFIPGTLLSSRYRIVARLGTGGMGEVYRADDLKLGQAVALKLLPESLEGDEERMARLLDEVRIARKVSHPNVCRVYDIGEVDGHQFITMEYIDGEDLATLLRRIGRLPEDKAVQIGRELCAGLAAAHDKGVVHRDLKPANVMIDGNGRASITDFGLAALVGDIRDDEHLSGTPAYMAPEQLAGKEATVQSDVYALGLILYEIITGKRAFEAHSVQDVMRLHRESRPATPSSLTAGIDPAIERAILRCLETEPEERPPSALAVAAALPGGDPLAAALAAGETPSPAMVAAAGHTEGLEPARAWGFLAVFLASVAVLAFLAPRVQLFLRKTFNKPPAVLEDRAMTIAGNLGYADPSRDRAGGFTVDLDYLSHVAKDSSRNRWDLLESRPLPTEFWFRKSPRYLAPYNLLQLRPSHNDPPLTVSGMVNVRTDTEGRLIGFLAVPPQLVEDADSSASPDWSLLFREAELSVEEFRMVPPRWNPVVFADRQAAWEGHCPGRPDLPMRLEAAAFRGKPVYFAIVWPWTRPSRMETRIEKAIEKIGRTLNLWLFLVLLVACGYAALRNSRRGRSDFKGAYRLGVFLLVISIVGWALATHHVPESVEMGLFVTGLSTSLFVFGVTWLFYVAIEPYVRRLMPDRIITWVRLMDGRFRDPLVGRDILLGCLLGALMTVVFQVRLVVPDWFKLPAPRPGINFPPLNLSIAMAAYLQSILQSVLNTLVILCFILLLQVLLKKRWLAVGGVFAILTLIITPAATGSSPVDFAATALFVAIFLLALLRYGLLAMIACFFVSTTIQAHPVSFSAWYSGTSFLAHLIVLALALYGFVTSLGGKPLFRDSVLDGA